MNTAALTLVRRPGKFWVFLQFPLTRIVLAGIAIIAVDASVQWGTHALHIAPRSAAGVLANIIIMAAVIAVYALYVHGVERRRVVEFNPSGAAPEIATGFAVGVVLFSLTMLLLWLLGIARFTFDGDWAALGFTLVAAVTAGIAEEVLVRGVLFRIIEESLGSWTALLISAAAFGAMHAFNPGATLTSSAAIALEAGVLLAAVFMYTRRLWMAIGLHSAWNFTEGGIFGASVSGSRSHGLLTSHFHGATWLSGGKFGPEASLVAVVVCFVTALVFLRLAWQQRQFIAPGWRRNAVLHSTQQALK